MSNTQVSTGRSCTSSVLPAAGAEDGHVKNAGKTEFRSRRLGLCFLSGVSCISLATRLREAKEVGAGRGVQAIRSVARGSPARRTALKPDWGPSPPVPSRP